MTRVHPDRRAANRLVARRCEHCLTSEHVLGVSRTDFAVYFRCSQCGHIYAMTKPNTPVSWAWDKLDHPADRR